jgi:hypothetical protein
MQTCLSCLRLKQCDTIRPCSRVSIVSKRKRPASPLRVVPIHILPLFRALSAALLTLALLSSAVPFAVLSASHSCSMPCCAGMEGGCSTGACKGALFKSPKKTEEEKLCGAEGASEAQGAAKKSHSMPPAEASAESAHCDSDKKEPAKESRSNKKETLRAQSPDASSAGQTNSISARAMASPCPTDCCAGASTSTQSRRGRDSALVSPLGRALPTSFISLSLYSLNLQPVLSAYLKRLKARAPPSILSSWLA